MFGIGPIGLSLGLLPAGRTCQHVPIDIVVEPDPPDTVPDGTPLENVPGWAGGSPGSPVASVKGRGVAMDRLEENGVAYRVPRAGPGKIKATLVDITTQQGVLAAAIADASNYVGVTWSEADDALVLVEAVDGVETELGAISLEPVSSVTEIGAVMHGRDVYATVNGKGVVHAQASVAAAAMNSAGILARGPVSAKWIDNLAVSQVVVGMGRAYGLSYGGRAAA